MGEERAEIFAVHRLPLASSSGGNEETIVEEVERWQGLRQEQLVSITGYTLAQDFLYVHFALPAHGSLEAFLQDFGPLEGPALRQATRGLLEGLDYLHTREEPMAHGNIRAASLLLDDGFCVKLGGFGVRQLMDQGLVEGEEGAAAASLPWAAPEVAQRRPVDWLKADMWSVGCTLLEMATAERPWGDFAGDEEVARCLKGIGGCGADAAPPIPAALPSDGRDVARQCLRTTPSARPSPAELLMHAFTWDFDC